MDPLRNLLSRRWYRGQKPWCATFVGENMEHGVWRFISKLAKRNGKSSKTTFLQRPKGSRVHSPHPGSKICCEWPKGRSRCRVLNPRSSRSSCLVMILIIQLYPLKRSRRQHRRRPQLVMQSTITMNKPTRIGTKTPLTGAPTAPGPSGQRLSKSIWRLASQERFWPGLEGKIYLLKGFRKKRLNKQITRSLKSLKISDERVGKRKILIRLITKSKNPQLLLNK